MHFLLQTLGKKQLFLNKKYSKKINISIKIIILN